MPIRSQDRDRQNLKAPKKPPIGIGLGEDSEEDAESQHSTVECPSLVFEDLESSFSYSALRGVRSIRLVVLEPSLTLTSPIRCRLIDVDLASSPPPEYEALSYVWGSQLRKTTITLNESWFLVTKNLWLALCRLRQRDKLRTLWVDAICVNQGETGERNHQVSMMREIYSTAQNVVIWVGEEADNSHLLFEHVNGWAKYCDDYRAGRVARDIEHHNLNRMPAFSEETREAFEKFCKRPWFFRTWVIQEVTLSQKATIMCGPHAMNWSLLSSPIKEDAYHPLDGVDGPNHLAQLKSIRTHRSLVGVLDYSRPCQTTEPVDKIYGILGLFDYEIIPVDYSLRTHEVFRQLTQSIVNSGQGIEWLSFYGTQRKPSCYPSWVPDFGSSTLPVGILPRARSSHTYNCPVDWDERNNLLSGWYFSDNDFIVRGKLIEQIKAVGDELSADPLFAPGSDAFLGVMHGWESLATAFRASKRFQNALSDAFSITIVGSHADHPDVTDSDDMEMAQFASHSAAFNAWYDLYGAGVLKEQEPDYFHQLEVIRLQDSEYDEKQLQLDVERFLKEVVMACYGRKFFVTDQGSMGLAPPTAEAGDQIAFFPGALYPFVVRPRHDGAFTFVGDCSLYDFNDYVFSEGIEDDAIEYMLR